PSRRTRGVDWHPCRRLNPEAAGISRIPPGSRTALSVGLVAPPGSWVLGPESRLLYRICDRAAPAPRHNLWIRRVRAGAGLGVRTTARLGDVGAGRWRRANPP